MKFTLFVKLVGWWMFKLDIDIGCWALGITYSDETALNLRVRKLFVMVPTLNFEIEHMEPCNEQA